MRTRYFTGTDTLWIELRPSPMVDTRDVDDGTLVEADSAGSIGAITIECASQRADLSTFDFERVTA